MSDLDGLCRRHARNVHLAVADVEPPPVESLVRASDETEGRWRRGVGVAVAAAALVVAVFLPVVLLTNTKGTPGETPEATSPGEPAGTGLGAEHGLLRVTQEVECCYTEGSFSYLRLVTGDGGEVLEEEYGLGEDPRLLLEKALPAGSYNLESWQRPCAGSCPPGGGLDPPTDRCQADFELQAGQRFEALVVVTPGRGCSISLGVESPPTLVPEAFALRERHPSCGSEYLIEEHDDLTPRVCLREAHREGRAAELESIELDEGGNPIRRWYRITPEKAFEVFVDATAAGAEAWEHFRCAGVRFTETQGGMEIVGEDCTDPQPLAVDRSVLPGDAALLALDARTGEVRWRVGVGGEALSGPAAGEDTLYVVNPAGGFIGMLRAFEAATGAEGWRLPMGRLLTRRPVVGGGLVYLSLVGMEGDGGAEVVAVDAEAGTERWRKKVGGEANPPPLLRGDLLYVGTDHPRLLWALEAGTGEVRWQAELPGPVPGTPVAGAGLLFVAVPLFADVAGGDEDRSQLIALDPETGRIRWSREFSGIVSDSPAAVADQVYIGLWDLRTDTGTLLSLAAQSGDEHWRFSTAGGIITSPATTGDLVLVAADRSREGRASLYGVDARTGEERWHHELSGEVAESIIVSGQVAYFSTGGKLLALELTTGKERWALEASTAGLLGELTAPTLQDGLVYVGES